MECFKEFPRSIGILTTLAGIVYLMAGMALTVSIGAWFAGGFAVLYILVHYFHYPRHACANCYYYGRHCISLKGKSAARIFRRGRESGFHSGMKLAMKGVYLVWIYPFVVLIGALARGRPIYFTDLLLSAILIVLMVMRQLMRRSLGCRVCIMRDECPNVGPDPRRTVKIDSGAPVGPGA